MSQDAFGTDRLRARVTQQGPVLRSGQQVCVSHVGYAGAMDLQMAVRLDEREMAALDAEVAAGRAASRSDAVRRSIGRLRREQRYRQDEAILLDLARRGEPIYPDLEGLSNARFSDLDLD